MNALAVIALSKRLRSLIARGSHRSELLETCDLLDVAIESPDTQTPAPPPALTPSLPPAPPPESKSEPSQPMQSDGGAGASLPDCKCWQVNGKRQVNRYCELHAAEWRTFAEQSAGELDPRERGVHPDGSSRAGCWCVDEGGKR